MSSRRSSKETFIPEVMREGPMKYVPDSELGVVFLFYDWAKKHRIRVERMQQYCPDCIALQKVGGREKRIRIEFELRSATFKQHKHDEKDVDWVVCWEDNWPGRPKGLKIVELRGYYGHGFNVWIQPVSGRYAEGIAEVRSKAIWSLSSQARMGDLVLFYHTRPEKAIIEIFKLTGPVEYQFAGPEERTESRWKRGWDNMGPIRLICRLEAPVFLEDLQNDRIIGTAGFIRGRMQGRPKATEYWPYIYDMIIARNPSLESKLKKYSPERLK